MDTSNTSDAHQENTTLKNESLLQQELDHLSIGTRLRLKRGYFAKYEQWAKRFNSFEKSDLPFDSTDCRYNRYPGVNNEQSDECQICSESDHVKPQTCRNANKCTQENRCDVINPKPFISVDGERKNGDDDVWSKKLTANVAESRIHKQPEFRQDIPPPSFNLNEYSKQVNTTEKLDTVRNKELQSEEPNSTIVPQQNPQLLKQSDEEKHVHDQGKIFHFEVYNDQNSALKILKPTDLVSFKHQERGTSCLQAGNEPSNNATYSHSTELHPNQAVSESSQPTIPTNRVNFIHVTDDTSSKQWPNLNHSHAEQVRQLNAYVCSSGDKKKLDTVTSEQYKNKDKTQCSISSASHEGKDAETIIYSGKHVAVLTYILSAAVIVLAFAVMHLHVKIESLEANRDVHNSKYQCAEKQPALLENQLLENVNTRYFNEKLMALLSTFKFSNMNTQQGTYQRNDDNADPSATSLQHHKDNKQPNKSPSFQRITNLSPSTTETEIASATTTAFGNSSRPKVNQNSEPILSVGVVRVDSSETGVHPAVLPRVVRSVTENQQEHRKRRMFDKQRKEFCKAYNKCSKTQIDSFEGHFPRVIGFKQKLSATECTSHEKWEPDITACRDMRVIFPKQYSILPFYLETNATATKKQKKRLVVTDDEGRFHVQKQGHYLIHVNITVVDPNGGHYLAVYVNNQAVLACPDGGFRCPDTNAPSAVKYRICNIIGLVECHRNDTVDIRTMEPNMTVRLENRQMSYFNFALLK